MDHVLDNPIWNALTTGNAALAEGDGDVRLFPADVAPFAGLREINPDNIARLYERVTPDRVVAIVAPTPIAIPAEWKVVLPVRALQMVFEGVTPLSAAKHELIPLGDQHIPAMLELTALTNPGPFYQRTILFGSYFGIFDGNSDASQDASQDGSQLVAMAGFRMHPGDFIEVSAVCTRPSHLGRGYARTLIMHLVGEIRARNCTPFLHVRDNNTRAIEVYEQLGFTTRHEMTINFIKKRV